MHDQKDLLLAWLEAEGERQRRPVPNLPSDGPLAPREWVQVGVCLFVGVLTFGILVCLLLAAWKQADRLGFIEQLRLEGIRIAVGDPDPSAWWKKKPAPIQRSVVEVWLLLGFRVVATAFGTVCGALILRAGCALYNRVAGRGSPSRVPEMHLGKALVVAFLAGLVGVVLGAGLLPALASFLVMAILVAALLPTPFTRAVLVSLCYLLVAAVVSVFLTLLLVIAPPVRPDLVSGQ